ncbi:hypothetical protein [Nocardiopsis sp. FIRDI 009]|uniref:hypothetical protein n=1 Tax=Nocardiopsis sp. FIRDI 009 TaxID=714197 RepID=UPI000E261826|nr:hypothetical protein [Nocardiopsis sp. FIRDI 009]
MYFHPPTFEPGPVATAIGLALIVCLIAQPLLFRPLYAAIRRPVPPAGRSPLIRLHRATAWWSLGEVFAGMLFVGTASAVTPADIGLALPVFHGFADRPGLLSVALSTAAFLALIVVPAVPRSWVLWRRLGGTLPANVQSRIPRRNIVLLPRNAAERRAIVPSSLTWLLGWSVSVHWVVVPLLMNGFGFWAWDALVFVFLLTLWRGFGTGWRGAGTAALVGAIATGWYLFVFVGSLVTPLLVWGVVLAASLAATPYRRPDDGEPAAAEPVMTWRPDDGTGIPEKRA